MNEEFFGSNQLIKSKKQTELFLIFTFSQKIYAIPAEKVVEIVQLPALTVVEKFPDYIVGLLNLRGQVISVIDPARLLGTEQELYTINHQILIVNCNKKNIGIIVHSVNDIVQINRDNLEPLPYKPKEKIISGIYKHENDLIAFLNINILLENVENIEAEIPKIKNESNAISNYFASDENSKIKFRKRAEKLQKEIRTITDDLNYQENYFISFCLNNEIYCINLKYVKEVTKLKLVNIASVPCVPKFITGIINLRGEFITIVDIKYFLNIPRTFTSDKTKIIVIKLSDIQLGLLVDEVFGIKNISNDKMNLNVQSKYEKNKYTSAEVLLSDEDFLKPKDSACSEQCLPSGTFASSQVMSIFDIKKFIEDERLYIEDSI